MIWHLKKFSDLTTQELYEILQLRQKVFIIEQNCPYLDADNLDLSCMHLMGYQNSKLVAYLRIVPAKLKYDEISFGRVAVALEARKQGLGKELTQRGLRAINELYGDVSIRISAQAYLEKFYTDFGFKKVSDQYMEDWIPHVEMLK